MDLLPMNFFIFRFCGIWKERESSNLIIHLVSLCYKYAVAILIYYFTISEVIHLIRTARMKNSVADLTESLFLILTFMGLCQKYLNFLVQQNELRALLDCFHSELCQSRNSAEESILKEYHRKAKRIIGFFMCICQTTGLLIIIGPLLSQGERLLPCKTYIPYSITPLLPYVLTYLQQALTLFYSVWLNMSLDSLVYGLIIHTCGQIELLCYRLTETFQFLRENNEKEISSVESSAVAECVRHHISVYNITHRIQSLFMWTITTMFCFSLITLCTSIYQMSKKKLFSPQFFTLIFYLSARVFQVFLYCWYGNELDLKTKNIAYAIYTSNWTVISAKQRKNLVFVMMMSQKGMMLSFHGICALILGTFMWIAKTSYSVFNLLQQASN